MSGHRYFLVDKQQALFFVLIFGCKIFLLSIYTPLYALDTNAYIRGMMTWSIYHNPGTNFFIGVLGKLGANAWAIAAVQCGIYSLAAAFFIRILFGEKRETNLLEERKLAEIQGHNKMQHRGYKFAIGFALIVAALEPVTLFYNFSLLSESNYIAFLLLSLSFLILFLRNPHFYSGLAFGLALAVLFWIRLAGLMFFPLLLFYFWAVYKTETGRTAFSGNKIARGSSATTHGGPAKKGVRVLAFAALGVIPLLFSIGLVHFGQKKINDAGLFVAKGRQHWDRVSSHYKTEEVNVPDFHRFVDSRILLANDPESRREFAYLGFRDCTEYYELQGKNPNRSVLTCDSLFGRAADEVSSKHRGTAWWQFVGDNFKGLFSGNYLDYRFTPSLTFGYSNAEYYYLDSLMLRHYGLDNSSGEKNIPRIWRSKTFANFWAILIFVILLLVSFFALVWQLIKKVEPVPFGNNVLTVRAAVTFLLFSSAWLPYLVHLFRIGYRLRFIAPVISLVLISGIWLVYNHFFSVLPSAKKPDEKNQ